MHIRNFSSGEESGRNPAWYWKNGLHDAQITRIEQLEYDFDYRLKNPVRNALVIHLDASCAMFDRAIRSIALHNYKILPDEFSAGSIEGCYWMQDRLRWENGKYILELILLGKDDFRFTVQFQDAVVTRK